MIARVHLVAGGVPMGEEFGRAACGARGGFYNEATDNRRVVNPDEGHRVTCRRCRAILARRPNDNNDNSKVRTTMTTKDDDTTAAADLAQSLMACTGAVRVTVTDGATTATATTPTLRLRDGRELTVRGGYGMNRQLRTMQNSAAVYWSHPHANSYVAEQRPDGTFRVVSINGIGEVRWEIDPLNLGWCGDGSAREAVAYFFEVQS